jgi:hypothetical protein
VLDSVTEMSAGREASVMAAVEVLVVLLDSEFEVDEKQNENQS